MGDHGGWNGLNIQNDTNVFEWISGEKVNFTYWRTGQPDNNYHCVHMYHNEQHKWQTKKCSFAHRSICEKGLFRFFVAFILLVENKIQSNNVHR